jgi:hydroxypyruvate isomerase
VIKDSTIEREVCFDLYHLQRTEGNLVVNLRTGLEQKLIKIVQIGDNPGRLERDGRNQLRVHLQGLRRLGYSGYLDTEMGTSKTPGMRWISSAGWPEEN